VKHHWSFATSILLASFILAASCKSPASGDTAAPTAGTAIAFSGTSSVATTVSWGAATDDATAASELQYKLVRSPTSAAIDSLAEADAIAGTGIAMDWKTDALTAEVLSLDASTTYWFAVLVKDASGNMGAYAPKSVTTAAPSETTPPILSGVSSGEITGTAASIAATSNEAGVVFYIVTESSAAPTAQQIIAGRDASDAGAAASGASSVSASTAKRFAVTGLANFRKYYYFLAAVDGSGNRSAVSGGSFATIGDGCVARFTFENSLADGIGSHSLAGGTASYSAVGAKEGSASLSLDGHTSFSSPFTLSNTESVSAWVYLTAGTGTYPTAMSLGGLSGLQVYNDGTTLFGSMGSGGATSIRNFYTTGAWHHVVVTADKTANSGKGAIFLYVDGIVGDNNDGQGDYSSETATLTIGDDSSGAYFWNGFIDDIQVYDRVLSASEVTDLYGTY
jgi:hypothetical protein